MALSFWDKIGAQLVSGPQGLADQEIADAQAQAQLAQQQQAAFASKADEADQEQLYRNSTKNNPNGINQYNLTPDEQLQMIAAQQSSPQFAQAAGMGANPYEKQYIDALISAQGLQKEGIGSIQKRILDLQNAPQRQDGLQQAIIQAADLWGGGGGSFNKMYNEANPNLTPQQRQAAITQLEDTLRKSKGDLSDSEIAVLKAKMGFAEAKIKAGQKGEGAQLPAGQAERIADLDTIGGQIDDLENQWVESFGSKRKGKNDYSIMAGIKAGLLPGSEEAMYEDSRKLKAQTIGRALEGGKLTDVDYTKYMKFIPSPSDTPARAKEKIENLRKYAENTKKTLVKTLGQSGYKVSGIETGSGGGLSQQQMQRLQQLRAMKAAGKI
jgi:hypothetical protein